MSHYTKSLLNVTFIILFGLNSNGQKNYSLKEIDSIRIDLRNELDTITLKRLYVYDLKYYCNDSSAINRLENAEVLRLENIYNAELPEALFLDQKLFKSVRVRYSDSSTSIQDIQPINSIDLSLPDIPKVEGEIKLSNQTLFLRLYAFDFSLNRLNEVFNENNNVHDLNIFNCTGENIIANSFDNFKNLKSLTLISNASYSFVDISNIKKFNVAELIININPNLSQNFEILKSSSNLKKLCFAANFIKSDQKIKYYRKVSPEILNLKQLEYFSTCMTLSKKNLKVLTSMTFLDELRLQLKGKIGSKRLTKFVNQLKNNLPNVNLILYDKNGEEIKITNDKD